MLGVWLKNLFTGKEQKGLWDTFDANKQKVHTDAFDKLLTAQKDQAKKFNFDDWVQGYQDLDKTALKYFKNVKVGTHDQDDFINAMNKTKVTVKATDSLFDKTKTTTKNLFSIFKRGASAIGGKLLGGLLNFGVYSLISSGISLVSKAIDNWIHADEKAIEASKKAQENIVATSAAYKKQSKAVEEAKENYADLYKGIDHHTNENISLSDEEYQNFLDISNQLAETFPSLVSGYDSAGNAMLNLGSNATTVAEQLDGLLQTQRQIKHIEIQEQATDMSKGIKASAKALKQEQHQLDSEIANLTKSKDSFKDLFTGKQAKLTGTEFILDSEFGKGIEKAIKDTGAQLKVISDQNHWGDPITTYFFTGSDEAVAEAKTKAQEYVDSYADTLQTEINKLKQESQANKQELNELWKSYLPQASALLETTDEFSGLSEKVQSALLANMTDVDFAKIGSSYKYNLDDFVEGEWIEPIRNLKPEAQDAIESLLELDASTLNLNDYKRTIAKELNSISDDVKVQKGWTQKLGLNDTIEEVEKQTRVLKDTFSSSWNEINNLTGSEREIAYDLIVNDKFDGTFNELMNRIKLAKSEMNLDIKPLYQGVQDAFESPNAGDTYVSMIDYLDKAKELYDKGLVGTDDFKAVAKWLSPTGADDPMNFQENWGKAKRYFTEDSSKGVEHFLKDLESKGYAKSQTATDAMGNTIKQWTYDIEDLKKASRQLGIGFEPFMSMWGRLEDYGFHNNFVGSLDQGKERISDLSQELADAEAELAEMEKSGIEKNGKNGNDTRITAQREKVAQLKQDIIETSDCMQQLAASSAETWENESKGAQEAIAVLQEEQKKILADENMDEATKESIVGMMQDQIDAWAEEYHLELEAEVHPELAGEEDLATELNVSSLDDSVSTALSSLEKLQKAGITSFEFDFSADSEDIDYEIQKANALLDQFRDADGNIDLSISGADEAVSILNALIMQKQQLNQPVIMHVDTSQLSGDMAQVIELLQQYQQKRSELQTALQLQQAGVDIDISGAEAEVQRLYEQIQNLDGNQAEIIASLGLDQSSIASLNSALDGLSPELMVKAGVDEAAIEEYDPEDKDADVVFGVDDTAVRKYAPSDKTAKVKYVPDTSALMNSLPPLQRTVQYVEQGLSAGASVGKKISKKVNGTAIAAFAKGTSIGLPRNETALVNELGTESIVRGDHWFPIPGGAHFEDLQKGDIIFNHLQTKELIKNGRVTSGGGHGTMAHAQGTAIQAFASGAGGGSFGVGGSGSKRKNSSSESKSSAKAAQSSAQAAKSSAQAAKSSADAADKASNLVDWIERMTSAIEHNTKALQDRIDDFELYRNQNKQIDAYVASAQNQIEVMRNAQNKYMTKANALGVPGNYVHKIWTGELDIEDIQDENLREKVSQYQEWYDAARNLGDQIHEVNRQIRETKIQKLENIQDDYDNLNAYHESLISINDAVSELSETQNLVGSQSALWNNLDQQKQIKAYYQASVREMQAQLDALVADGTIGLHSDTWLKWTSQINEAKKAIIECDSAVEELKASIMEIRLDSFNKMLETLEHSTDMASSLRALMSSEGIFDDDIKITDNGYAQLALLSEELVNSKQSVANYNKAIEALNQDLKVGNVTQAQYNKKLQEYEKAQMDAVKAVQSARDAILDIVKDGINKETEAMEELISKRKDDLSAQKEYYDFQKKMMNQSKEMNKLRAQLAALEGDDSLEAQQKRRKLNSQLQEMQDQYDEDQKDHEYDVVQDAYDETLDKFKENQEEILHDLETNLDAQNQAIQNYLSSLTDNYQLAFDQLKQYADAYGINLSTSLTQPWQNAQNALNQYLQAVGKVDPNINIDTGQIESNYNPVDTSNKVGNEANQMSPSKTGQWIQQDGNWWYQHNDGSYSVDRWEQIDGTWYKFDRQGWMQTGWQPWGKDSKGREIWYYLQPSGAMATSQWITGKDGKQYYVDKTGAMVRESYVKAQSGGLYYWVNAEGVWEPQWNTYNPDLSKYKLAYAKGSRSTMKGLGKYDESGLGSEFIISKQGILREFKAGEMVFNSKQKNALYNFSADPTSFLKNLVMTPNIDQAPKIVQPIININESFNIDKVDNSTLPNMKQLLEDQTKYMIQKLRGEMKKLK